MDLNKKYSKRVFDSVVKHGGPDQWERAIAGLLHKLELPKNKREEAKNAYSALGRHIAKRLGVGDTDVHVLPQGSMASQTTVSGYGPEKFDLDVVVKLTAAKYNNLRLSEEFFQDFGKALKGVAGAGEPAPKNRCWRLQYPGQSFYFDVTPALPMSSLIVGTELRVRDEKKVWAPSNPEDLLKWFEEIAKQRFSFQDRVVNLDGIRADTRIDPLPDSPVRIDDILRRTVQLIKVHRNNYYRGLAEYRCKAQPISIILVTLATQAYEQLVRNERFSFSSAIEVALEIVDRLPQFIDRTSGSPKVPNPKYQAENFADKWAEEAGQREREFYAWHGALCTDLEAFFSDEYSRTDEARIKRIFGQDGVDAWKGSLPATPRPVFGGLLANPSGGNPSRPIATGSRNTGG